MKDALPVLAIAAVALALLAVAIFGAGDRQILVPPPDAVAESFAREIVEERYALALKYLSRDLRQRVDATALRAQLGALRVQLGPANSVQAELDWMTANEAAARAMIESQRGAAVLSIAFTRERGLWRVRAVPEPAIAANVRARR